MFQVTTVQLNTDYAAKMKVADRGQGDAEIFEDDLDILLCARSVSVLRIVITQAKMGIPLFCMGQGEGQGQDQGRPPAPSLQGMASSPRLLPEGRR